ncbi:MAG: archease [candidate division Zixibacteria bacterium]|nr:archease [candidate division Zixibacteria bacterium]
MHKQPKYKIIEAGAFADFEFEAYGDSLEELFAVCGIASFEAMTDTAKVEPKETVEFAVDAETVEDLLFAFLAELIYIKDVEKIFFKQFDIEISGNSDSGCRPLEASFHPEACGNYKLKCKATGEYIDIKKHDLRTDVKAVTYHKLSVRKTNSGYSGHVILDL